MSRPLTTFAIALAATAAASVANAGDDLTSLSYISYLERYATVKPAQEGETLDAVVNMPVLSGDRLETARRGRVEVQLADGSTLWVDEFTAVDFDALAYSRDDSAPRTVLYLDGDGEIAIEIPATALGDGTMRVDTERGTVYLNRPGLYRLEMGSGQLHVEAHSGLAELPAGAGSTLLRGGQEAYLSADQDVQKNVLAATSDDFWSWVEDRRHPADSGQTAEYVDSLAARRAAVLDSYGDWVYVPTFSSYMWRPHVAVGWTPYSCGRWVWTPVGWTWVSYEPWGWYPSHYGSWYLDASFGWVWSFDSVWGPAWVHWIYTPGYVGWCPRGYYDWWYWHDDHDRFHGGGRGPGRWSDVAIDFHGRVGLRDVDPRPWTLVPSDRFTSSHLERVRVDTSRVFRDDGDRTAMVGSGPLLTPPPGRSSPDRFIDTALRSRGDAPTTPGLSRVLRREGVAGPGGRPLDLPTVRTGEIIRSVEREIPQRGVVSDVPRQERSITREPASDIPTRRLGWTDRVTGREPSSGTGAPNGGVVTEPVSRTIERRVTRSREVERSTPSREVAPPQGGATSRPAVPSTSRPAAPSTSRPSGQSAPSRNVSAPRPRAEPRERPNGNSARIMDQERSIDRSWASRSQVYDSRRELNRELNRELIQERARVGAFAPAERPTYNRSYRGSPEARGMAPRAPAFRGSEPRGEAFVPRGVRPEANPGRSWSPPTSGAAFSAPRATVRSVGTQFRAPSFSRPSSGSSGSTGARHAERPHR